MNSIVVLNLPLIRKIGLVVKLPRFGQKLEILLRCHQEVELQLMENRCVVEGNAGLFPKSAADKLKGKDFKNFDEFRSKFRKAASEDPNLASQFSNSNVTLIKQDKAPITVDEQWLGRRMIYKIHHKTPIHDGGGDGVYYMDNLVIITPKNHKEI